MGGFLALNPDHLGASTLAVPPWTAIAGEADSRLWHSLDPAQQDVTCHVGRGMLRLIGRLPTYPQRQTGRTIVAEVGAVRQVIDFLSHQRIPAHHFHRIGAKEVES